ncbi:hypothetical protein BSZ19_03445 [Bradyrhizobium japonicum]|uniref:Transposase n=1 Tax=Bradyrhizobium japonicum TaxID=375 RepID=A0A1Y2JWT0_BRAJP|nr:hypothetical protein BSZ19_03445 [Bradyrhizobium japonicum]
MSFGIDEKSQIQALERELPALAVMPGYRGGPDTCAVDACCLQRSMSPRASVIGKRLKRHRAIELLKFLKRNDAPGFDIDERSVLSRSALFGLIRLWQRPDTETRFYVGAVQSASFRQRLAQHLLWHADCL